MDTKTVTLQLPTQLYADLEAMATDEQTNLVEMIARLVAMAQHYRTPSRPTTRAFQRILDRATDLGVADLAEQHDHYLYGADKQ